MKAILYLTKTKILVSGTEYQWNPETLEATLQRIKIEKKIKDVRIVLGNDTSYVIAVKKEPSVAPTRNEVLKISFAWLPFRPTDDSFDWKLVRLGEDDEWFQIIAVEPELLTFITDAVKKLGLSVQEIIPIAAVVGSVSIGKETPMIIKWEGVEKFAVLAQRGLIDLVSDDSDQVIAEYAKTNWHLAVNPEIIRVNEKSIGYERIVMEGKVKGPDAEVLNIGLARYSLEVQRKLEAMMIEKDEVEKPEPLGIVGVREVVLIILIMLVVGTGVGLGIFNWNNSLNKQTSDFGTPLSPQVTQSLSVTPTASPTATVVVDLGLYKVQIQNGSGVPGEASKMKTFFENAGFKNVEVGNAPDLALESTVSYKQLVPAEVVAATNGLLSDYQIGQVNLLTSSENYDLIIVVGSTKR